jgi:hypothetical protein
MYGAPLNSAATAANVLRYANVSRVILNYMKITRFRGRRCCPEMARSPRHLRPLMVEKVA